MSVACGSGHAQMYKLHAPGTLQVVRTGAKVHAAAQVYCQPPVAAALPVLWPPAHVPVSENIPPTPPHPPASPPQHRGADL